MFQKSKSSIIAFSRLFTTRPVSYSKYFMQTTLNPKEIKLSPPSNLNSKSLLLLSTPSLLPQIIQESIHLYQEENLQVCVAGVDTMVPNSVRNGLSELWMDEHISINESTQLDDKDDLNNTPKESDGINIVVARKNWKIIDSNLKIILNTKNTVHVNLANTAFSTDHLVTLFYLSPIENNDNNMGRTLSNLSITLPPGIIKDPLEVIFQDNWTPLTTSEELVVTDCVGNLLKSINNQPASNFLQNNKKLMDLASKDTQVYVKLYSKDSILPRKFEVIAGGGSWGTKANILALSPEAKLKKGEKIEFYMLTPSDRFIQKDNQTLKNNNKNKFTFECSYEPHSYDSNHSDNVVVLHNIFGCGSEKGFIYNNINHYSAGENLILS